eukprot:TRINITY_DN31648_c0_g1_i1.p1 TRINITY_DN31648_c0_g1~~TRINITY_DN31648_c0_g1_i1.p1  ORF type:complete len:277 (-),score=124.75 TRINITY_DN31648_c0_g1_i1:561-1391(-)
MATAAVQQLDIDNVVDAFRTSERRLLLLDYDGTLTPIVADPSKALPPPHLLDTLHRLHGSTRTTEYIVTGRDRQFIERHLASELDGVGFSCEHGALIRWHVLPGETTPDWDNLADSIDLSWRAPVLEAMADAIRLTPGSRLEKKQVTQAWHYREAHDPTNADEQRLALLDRLRALQRSMPAIDVPAGTTVIEVRPRGYTKGSVVRNILSKTGDVDFVLCLGDDKTDEDMFNAILESCAAPHKYTVSVRQMQPGASYMVDSTDVVLSLLQKLARTDL